MHGPVAHLTEMAILDAGGGKQAAQGRANRHPQRSGDQRVVLHELGDAMPRVTGPVAHRIHGRMLALIDMRRSAAQLAAYVLGLMLHLAHHLLGLVSHLVRLVGQAAMLVGLMLGD